MRPLSSVSSSAPLESPKPPSEFPIRTQLTWRGNPEGFNRSQSIGLPCTNKRHGLQPLLHPSPLEPSCTNRPNPRQSFLGRRWAWRPGGRLPTARNQRRFATFLAAVTRACQSPALPARHLRPLLSDWLLFSPKKKVNISMPTAMQSDPVRTHANASEYVYLCLLSV